MRRLQRGSSSWLVALGFVLLTLAMTWPLLPGLSRDVPGDLGDSLLNMWILGWGAEHLPRVASGQMTLRELWNANIFHPEPLALSFSEHLFGQVLQILPVYHLTGNLILSYNLLFLSTFVLSGLGMYLFVRDLLNEGPGINWPALVAGVIFAFIPFRIAQVAHIQSLSSQWMPFALLGFRRFTTTRSVRSLAGGTAALLMQNWSCGYYLIFFAPFVVLFVLHQIHAAGRGRDARVWGGLTAAAIVVALGTWPFLSLYLDARRVHAFERSIGEVMRFSADVFSYFSAPDALRLWGGVMQAYPKAEGELFFGIVPMLLTAVAVGGWILSARMGSAVPNLPHWTRWLTRLLAGVATIQLAGLIGIVLTGGFVWSIAGIPIRATNPTRLAVGIAIAVALLLVLSPNTRQRSREAMRSPLVLAVVLAVLATWLSLGPLPQSRGRSLAGLGLYGVLYEHVPGFDGLRVPARYAMVAALFLSIAAAYGFTAIARRTRPSFAAAVVAGAFLLEAAFVPMPLNQTWGDGGVMPPTRVEPPALAPAVYQHLAGITDARVIVEFPFGDPAWELRYVYYSTLHWKRLVNGYSGGFPQGYKVRVARLQRFVENPEDAWRVLREAGVTHAIVHEAAYPVRDAAQVQQWLTVHGAVARARFGSDILYELPR